MVDYMTDLEYYLQSGKLYKMIEDLDIPLGVADKSLLISHLSRTPNAKYFDIWHNTLDYLWNMGFSSEKFIAYRRDEQKHNEESNRIFLKGRTFIPSLGN